MPQQVTADVSNNFTKGLVTEATALNFPENAATDTDNCDYSTLGDVSRRLGINFEVNYALTPFDRTNTAINTYKWLNAGGDGNTSIIVEQVGTSLLFYVASFATIAAPLSTTKLSTTVFLPSFTANGGTFDATREATFADGNGYLFVFHPSMNTIYVTYDPISGVQANLIDMQVRDFVGVSYQEGPANQRPLLSSSAHSYNLVNQGWSQGSPWSATYTSSWTIQTGPVALSVQPGIVGVTPGQSIKVINTSGSYIISAAPGYGPVAIPPGTQIATGTVTSYAGTTLNLNISATNPAYVGGTTLNGDVYPLNIGYVNTFSAASGFYPSNADVWWYFKNASGVFDPATTLSNVTLSQGNAPRGAVLFNPFNQDRTVQSGVPGLNPITTVQRPSNGAWFQGRLFYAGVEAYQIVTGTAPFYTWTENIYFSQVVEDVSDFGKCYQKNDPTSETLFDLLPTDGGVITIQGCGSIYKLFPIQNGMLVFASNGVWFITGSQGIGFTATDYTITKISSVKSISTASYVDVLGLPYFWNEEGIYAVEPADKGGLSVNNKTYGTISTFYEEIPLDNKRYARGAYDPVSFTIQWVYRDTASLGTDSNYSFNRMLNYNTYNKAFFPYSLDISSTSNPTVNGIVYIQSMGFSNSPPSAFMYFSSYPGASITQFTYSHSYDTEYVDWNSFTSSSDYTSYFITGYRLRGQAIKRFQPQYIQVYSKTNGGASSYKIQGIWDYANSGDSGRWSTSQLVTNGLSRFDTTIRRHKIRGHGYALQFKISSVPGMDFDIQGWAVVDTTNQGT